MYTDADGSISFLEAAVALSVLEARTPTEKLKCMYPVLIHRKLSLAHVCVVLFKLFDEDGDGYIDKNEVTAVKKQLVATALFFHDDADPDTVSEVTLEPYTTNNLTTEQYFDGVLKELDANGDGQISLEEWVQVGVYCTCSMCALHS